MDKGPKVSQPEYIDFNSDEDDLLGDDDLLIDNSSDENYDELYSDPTSDGQVSVLKCHP